MTCNRSSYCFFETVNTASDPGSFQWLAVMSKLSITNKDIQLRVKKLLRVTPQLSAKAEKELLGNQVFFLLQSRFFLLQSRLFITRAAKNQGDAKIICKELCTDCTALRHSKGSYKSELSIQCSAELLKIFHCALLARPSGPVQCSAVHSQSLKCFSLEKPRLLSFIHQTPTTLCSTPTNLPCVVHMKNSSPPTPIQRPDSSSYCAVHNLVNFQKSLFCQS